MMIRQLHHLPRALIYNQLLNGIS